MNKWILSCSFLLISACSDTSDSHYKDLKDAIKNGAVMRGWIPSWLPATARNIKESHNVDTNGVIISWKYSENWQVPDSCIVINPYDATRPDINSDWWPTYIPPNKNSAYKHLYYLCGNNEYLAIEPELGEAYYWNNNIK